MKRIINLLSLISAIVTCGLIICTFMTSYQFFYVGQVFNSYMPIQVGSAVTMALLALRFLLNENGSKRITYSAISILISLILIFSISLVK